MPRHFFNFMYPVEAQKIHDGYSSFIHVAYNVIKDLFVFTPKSITNKIDNNTGDSQDQDMP